MNIAQTRKNIRDDRYCSEQLIPFHPCVLNIINRLAVDFFLLT